MIGTGALLDLLTVRDIRDGVVFGESGQLSVAFDIYFPSARLMTYRDRALVAEHLSKITRQVVPIGGRLRLYVEAIESGLDFPTEFLTKLERADEAVRDLNRARLDAMRLEAAHGRVRQWYVTLIITWLPTYIKKAKESYTPEEYNSLMVEAEQIRSSTLNILERAKVQATPMDDAQLTEMLWRYFNPSLVGHKPRPPKEDEHPLERLVVSGIKNNQDQFITVGGVHIGHIVFHRGPRYTMPGLLDILLETKGEFILVIEIVRIDQLAASSRANLNRTRLENLAADLGNRADPEMVEKARLLAKALTRRAQTGENIVEVGVQLILRNRELTLLQTHAAEAYGKAQSLADAQPVKLPPNALEYWIAASPFHGQPLIRRWQYLDLNATHLTPQKTPWRGSPGGLAYYLSREGAVVGINPFDPRSPAWNGVLVGGSGSGKTFFTQSYITSFLTTGSFVAIIDKGGGYVPLTELLGGTIIYFEPGAGITINPFDLEPGQVEPTEEKKGFLVALLKQMIPSRGDEAKEAVILNAAVERVYKAHQTRRKRPDGSEEVTLKTPTLSDFRRILLTMDEAYGQKLTEEDRQLASSMAQALSLWTAGTPQGRLVDGPTTIDLTSKVVYFETTGISTNEDLQRVGLLLLIDLIWRRVARDPAERKLLVFDEVWSLLKSRYAALFVEDLYRRLRRYGAGALSISQSLEDFVSGYANGIVVNANYYFLLAAPNQDRVLREVLKLPEDLIRDYASLKPKGEILFLLRSEGYLQGDILRYVPSAYEIAAFGTQADEQVLRRQLKEELGSLAAAARYMHLKALADKL